MKSHKVVERNEENTQGYCKKCQKVVNLISPPGKLKEVYCEVRVNESKEAKRTYDHQRRSEGEPYKYHNVVINEGLFICRICGELPYGQTKCLTAKNKPMSHARLNGLRTRSARNAGMLIECYQTTYDELNRKQSGCLICKKDNVKLVIDHDHSTGIPRGLLCHQCNVGLGMFKDNIDYLLSAAKYLGH